MKKVRFDAPARLKIRDAFHFSEKRQSGLGKRLLAAVDSALPRIKTNPNVGRVAPHGMRRCSAPNFPYHVVFESQSEGIYIFAVAHLRRDPDYWIDRLPSK